MKFRYVLIALAGALLCSCRNVVTWDCDEDWNSDFESAGEPSFGYQNDNEIFEYGNVCFYIEDSIAVIAPSVSDLMSIKAINAGYYRGDVVIPKTVSLNGKTYPVRKIGNSAFGSAFDVSSIDIPEGVTEIEYGYDMALYFLKGIARYGTGLSGNINAISTKPVQMGFKFQRAHCQSYPFFVS